MTKKIATPGSWRSPITSDLIVSASVGLGEVKLDRQEIYWLERRPTEAGRNVLVQQTPQGNPQDMTPAPLNVRTRVHEYGGGAFLVVDGTVYFSNFADRLLYRQAAGESPQPLTEESARRYADLIFDRSHNRLICICEDRAQEGQEPENTIISVDINTGAVTTLVSGSDFYAAPRLSPDGTQLAWMSWEHPQMPWDGTQLWLATVNADGSLGKAECIAGGTEESICQPEWSPDGKLYFVSDRSGWWNLYRYQQGIVTPLFPLAAEFGYPHWVFGISLYGFATPTKIICSYSQNGRWYLASLDVEHRTLTAIDTPYTNIASLQVRDNLVVFIGGSPTETTAVVKLDLDTGTTEILRRSGEIEIDPDYISIPEAIAFPTSNGLTAYAWYYPPKNKDYTAPPGELPPLLVKSHGGPTAAASATLTLRVQYWTSRGFAVLDVNYGGSTGYGRQYRQRLRKNWGIVDVEDCVNAAQYLVAQDKVAVDKLAISGGSAGGYTTLAALTFHDTFQAGASYYGVSDLEALAKDTHKFESRYLDGLVGKYPEEQAIYQQRSPINFTEQLSCPVIFFQGLEDKVVPPNQAEMMVEAMKAKGLPVAYVPFAEEQHGFRRAENIKRALDGEFYFYSRIFGFQPAEELEPVEISNLKTPFSNL